MSEYDSDTTIPYRIWADDSICQYRWEVDHDGSTIEGTAADLFGAIRGVNLIAVRAGFPPIIYRSKPHRTSAPHLLRKGSRTLAYFREAIAPGLFVSLMLIVVANAVVFFANRPRFPVFAPILLFPLPVGAAIALIRRAWILREWNAAWRPPPEWQSSPWPLGGSRPPGDPAKAPPLPWMGKNRDARDEEETAIFWFLNEARQIHQEASGRSHPLLDALRERALEKEAHVPDHFRSPSTFLQQSVNQWMGDRLRNMRHSTRFVREAYDANPPRDAKPRCRINYIQSASDFSKEWERLCRLRARTEVAASYMVAASLFLVPMAAYFCWTYKWELGLPPRFYLSVTIALPAAILALRATMRRAREEGKDLYFQFQEAKLLAPVEDAPNWSFICHTPTSRR